MNKPIIIHALKRSGLFFTALTVASLIRADQTIKYGEAEWLGQPCRSKQINAGRVVVDRADGRDRFVLTNINEATGMELLFIDFENDSGRVYTARAGAGAHALSEIPGDRLAIGTLYDGTFVVFDLKKMEFIRTVKFPGEQYIWRLVRGADGRLYGGTYPGARLGALDLDTYAFEDLGAPAPPNLYLQSISATPEGLIVCNFGQQEPKTLAFDPATKKFLPPPPGIEKIATGVSWNGYYLSGAQAVEGLAVDGRFAYVGTSLYANGLPEKKGEWARFGVIDLASKKAVWQEVFEQAKAVRPLALDSATRRVAMVVEGGLRVFDTARRRFISDFGPALPRITSRSIAAPGNGILYAGNGRKMLAISLKTGRSEHVGELPAAVSHVTAIRDRTVYVSCNTDVYRLRPMKYVNCEEGRGKGTSYKFTSPGRLARRGDRRLVLNAKRQQAVASPGLDSADL